MPECTYLDENQRKELISVKNPEVNELFQEVRKTFNDKYFLREMELIIPRFLRKPKKEVIYTLYFSIHWLEVQVINFGKAADSRDIINYFYALLNGYRFCKEQQIEKIETIGNDLFMTTNKD